MKMFCELLGLNASDGAADSGQICDRLIFSNSIKKKLTAPAATQIAQTVVFKGAKRKALSSAVTESTVGQRN